MSHELLPHHDLNVDLSSTCRALQLEDGTYAPAYALPDGRLERAGRVSKPKVPPPLAGPQPGDGTVKAVSYRSSEDRAQQDIEAEGRGQSSSGSFARTAAILAIGDELLSGKVRESVTL